MFDHVTKTDVEKYIQTYRRPFGSFFVNNEETTTEINFSGTHGNDISSITYDQTTARVSILFTSNLRNVSNNYHHINKVILGETFKEFRFIKLTPSGVSFSSVHFSYLESHTEYFEIEMFKPINDSNVDLIEVPINQRSQLKFVAQAESFLQTIRSELE